MTSRGLQPKARFRAVWRNVVLGFVVAAGVSSATGHAAAQAQPASEEKQDDAEALITKAVELYHAENFEEAIKIFRDVYILRGDPNLLFNIARCHEALGQPLPARKHYEAYLSDEQAEPAGIERAKSALRRLDEVERAEAEPEEAAAPNPEPELDEPKAPRLSADAEVADSAPTVTGEKSQWLEYTLLSLGTVGLGVGGTYYVLGTQDHQELEDADGYLDSSRRFELQHERAQELKDSGDEKKAIGVAGMAVGGGLVVSAVMLWLLSDDEQGVVVSASGTAGGGELSVGGQF